MGHIPDGETLYRYVKPQAFPSGQTGIPSSVFNDPELSCDWERHQPNPETSFHIAQGKTTIISIFICDAIRNPLNPKRTGQKVPDWQQEIGHYPTTIEDDPQNGANFSHSLIKGKKSMAVSAALQANSIIHMQL